MSAITKIVDEGYTIIDNRFFWLPQYTIKFSEATTAIQQFGNTAYAYCQFNQFTTYFGKLVSVGSGNLTE